MPVFPSLPASLGLLFLGLVVAVLALIAGGSLGLPLTALVLASSLAGSGTALGVGLACAGRPWSDPLRLGAHPARGWAPLAPLLAGAVLAASEIENSIRAAWPPPASFTQAMQQILAPGRPLDRALAFVLAGLAAPLIEELLFRGLIQRGLVSRYGPSRGIALSAALFGAYHLYPWQAVPAAALGILFGWVTWRSGRIGYAMGLHAGNNLLALWLAGAGPALPGLSPHAPEVAHLPPAALAAAAALLACGAVLFARAFPAAAGPPAAAAAERPDGPGGAP